MTEITKTIQIYEPKEKLPVVGCNFIATVKGYDHEDEEFKCHVPDEMHFGTISTGSSGEYLLIDAQAGTIVLNEKEFKERVLEWYYLPC